MQMCGKTFLNVLIYFWIQYICVYVSLPSHFEYGLDYHMFVCVFVMSISSPGQSVVLATNTVKLLQLS